MLQVPVRLLALSRVLIENDTSVIVSRKLLYGDNTFFIWLFVPTLETSDEFVSFKTKGFNYKDSPPYCVAYCFYPVTRTLHDDPTIDTYWIMYTVHCTTLFGVRCLFTL